MPFFQPLHYTQKIILRGKRTCETPISTIPVVIFFVCLDFEKIAIPGQPPMRNTNQQNFPENHK